MSRSLFSKGKSFIFVEFLLTIKVNYDNAKKKKDLGVQKTIKNTIMKNVKTT